MMQQSYRFLRNVAASLCLLATALLASLGAHAQDRQVSGKVIDAGDGSAVPGVNVSVKGTTRGVTTSADGAYQITASSASTLVFSFIGYATQEILLGNQSTLNVSLATDARALQEVVVVGYGTQRSKDVTGGVVSITPKDFNKGVIVSPEQLLQGRAAGVQITPASGEPGAGINVRIRGAFSLRGSSNPLYVIDGVPLDGGDVSSGGTDFGSGSSSARNPLNFLNPNDIENVSVLKDASAAAIYGARGANGVVLITTRKGKAGQQSFNFSGNTGVSTVLRKYDLLNRDEFLQGVKDAGGDATVVDLKGNTDWQKEILRTGVSQNYSMNFGGGNDNTRYYFSLGYTNQGGIIKKANLERLTGRVNASHELFNDKVVLDLNVTTSNVKDVYVQNGNNAGYQGNLIGAAIGTNPTAPVYNADGTFYQPGGDFRNVVALLDLIDDNSNTNRTLANVSATWRIFDGLSLKANFGIDGATSVRRTSIDPRLNAYQGIFGEGRAQIDNRYRNSRLIEYTANYTRKIGTGNLDAVVGFSYQKFENRGNSVSAKYFNNTQVPIIDNIDGADNQGSTGNNKAFGGASDRSQNELQSYFGRVNYNFNDKYLVTATVRVDGSSRFGVNNKYGAFPSLAAAWRLSNEAFIPKDIFTDLKLRANWGLTGNQEFPGGVSKIIYSLNSNGSVTQQNNANPDIRWEQSQQFGIGLDFAVLSGRLSGTLDYFNKSIKDQLQQVIYAQPAPVRYKWLNLPGSLNTSGLELSLAYQAVRGDNFGWEILYNLTSYLQRNVAEGFGSTIINTGEINGQGLSGAYAQQIVNGQPAPSFYLPTFTGYDSEGLGTYADGGAAVFQGSPLPKLTMGLTNNFTFGRLNASLFFNGNFGGVIYNNTANAVFIKGVLKNGRNVTRDVLTNGENPLNSGSVSTRFLEKANFVRLANASVGYNFNLPSGGFAKTLNVSLTGQNLLLFTNYTGIDPEVNTPKAIDGVPSFGIDYTTFPTARTVTIGLNVGF